MARFFEFETHELDLLETALISLEDYYASERENDKADLSQKLLREVELEISKRNPKQK